MSQEKSKDEESSTPWVWRPGDGVTGVVAILLDVLVFRSGNGGAVSLLLSVIPPILLLIGLICFNWWWWGVIEFSVRVIDDDRIGVGGSGGNGRDLFLIVLGLDSNLEVTIGLCICFLLLSAL